MRRHPEAPLTRIIDEEIQTIVENHRKKGIELDTKLLTDTIMLKRLVMKRCVYGVDLNPLAVELAELSLWLDSFTIGVPLTYLDNHIRCGDSLIGLRLHDIREWAPDETLDHWAESLSANRETLENLVSSTPDLTKEQVEQSRSNYDLFRENTTPQRSVLDMICAELLDEEVSKKLPRNIPLVEKSIRERIQPEWWKGVKTAIDLSQRYNVFHWELEFPEAFTNGKAQFNLVLTNPPWDAVKPEDDDFFSSFVPAFRRFKDPKDKQELKQELLKTPDVATLYHDYERKSEARSVFFKSSEIYQLRGSGDLDLWKLFLERAFGLLREEGVVAIVTPSALVTNLGAIELRRALF